MLNTISIFPGDTEVQQVINFPKLKQIIAGVSLSSKIMLLTTTLFSFSSAIWEKYPISQMRELISKDI